MGDAAGRSGVPGGSCLRPLEDVVDGWIGDVWRAAVGMVGDVERLILSDHGLTWGQWELLRYLAEEGAAPVPTAATDLGVGAAQVVVTATELGGRGLAYLPSTRSDVRVVAATERGYGLVPGVRHAIAVRESRLLCPLPPIHVLAVTAVLQRAAARSRDAVSPACAGSLGRSG